MTPTRPGRETRTLTRDAGRLSVEVRAAAAGSDRVAIVDGYASVYDWLYPVAGGAAGGGWDEQFAPGAFAKSLAERAHDMFLLFDHDGLPLAGVRNGSLTLTEDEVGLRLAASVAVCTPWRVEVVQLLDDMLVDAMSLSFQSVRSEWSPDYTTRRIVEAKLFEVSLVKWAANTATVAQVRSAAGLPDMAPTQGSSSYFAPSTLAAYRAEVDARAAARDR